MNMNSALSNYEALATRRANARAEMERIEEAYEEATAKVFDQIFDVLNPGEGMTARQISQTLNGVIGSHEVADRLANLCYTGSPMHNKFTYKQESVTTYYREVDGNGKLVPNDKIYTRTAKVNVYRVK